MCGIAGFIDLRRAMSRHNLIDTGAKMAERLTARGPDGSGTWADAESGVAFGHRRLAIIDASDAGTQPMVSASGRWVIVYNGELYNTDEMRAGIADRGLTLRGHADTEVLLETIEAIGVEAAAQRANGIFAFAAWDCSERKLWLVRDRLGVKPLYWGWANGSLLFASQPKAFFAHPDFTPAIDDDGLGAYLRYGYVPAPLSIYRGIRKLPGGWLAEIDADGSVDERCWWDLRAIATAGQAAPTPFDPAALAELIDDAVARQMVSDVPLGAFLSGGVDSATVVAAMQARAQTPTQTFAVGFDAAGFDETAHARAVADHLGTDHTELRLTPADVPGVLATMIDNLDEPNADVSLIPMYAVSKLARGQVTVALSGDGGDELFAGYNHYRLAQRAWALARRLPWPLGAVAQAAIRALGPLLRVLPLGPPGAPYSADRLAKVADLLPAGDPIALYRRLVSLWAEPASISARAAAQDPLPAIADPPRALGLPRRFQYVDILTYLPESILAKVDRASMATSLEARVPLLDHRIVEMIWRTDPRELVGDGTAKWALRQVLYRRVPRHLIERPKMGFGVPIGDWLRGPLRGWAEPDLAGPGATAGGLVRADAIDRRWQEHLAERRNWQQSLWNVIVLAHWQRRWLKE